MSECSTGRLAKSRLPQLCACLIEAAKQGQNRQVYPFIVIGSATSIRRMEIVSIRREHIDLAGRVIYVPKAKAGTREQPITRASCRRAFLVFPYFVRTGIRLRETTVGTAASVST